MTDEELTRQVAEEVMGWYASDSGTWRLDTVINQEPCAYSGEERLIFWRWDDDIEHSLLISDWNPLTDPRHWWQVVERMRELGWLVMIVIWPEKYQVAIWKQNIDFSKQDVDNPNIGRAVCEAALAAVRGEKK